MFFLKTPRRRAKKKHLSKSGQFFKMLFPGEEAYVSIFQTHETKVPTSHFSDIFKPKERIKLEKKITRKN